MGGKLIKRIAIISSAVIFTGLLTGIIILGLLNDKKRQNIELCVIDPIETEEVKTEDEDKISFTVKTVYRQDSDPVILDAPPPSTEVNEYGIEYVLNTNKYREQYTVTAEELVEWAWRAYDEEWEYTYGGCEEGHVDCSGLIKSKVLICARGTEELMAESAFNGTIDTIPDIPGLGVYYYGHVGIYVGDGMIIDARTESSGVGYDAIDYEGWTNWFEIKGVDYSKYTNNGYE